MNLFISLLTLICANSISNDYKIRVIRAKETLHEAKFIKNIIVLGYEGSNMLYKQKNSKDTFKINCEIRKTTESFRLLQIKKGFIPKSSLSGKWPLKGQKVLIVIDSLNKVNLFATLQNGDYRFWDPNSAPFANSTFEIKKERPFKPLPSCQNYSDQEGDYWFCVDGFLAIAFDIHERS